MSDAADREPLATVDPPETESTPPGGVSLSASARSSTAEYPDLSYDGWTRLLCERFFPQGAGRRAVTLFVDDEVLADMTGLKERDAVQSLAGAVNSQLESGANAFRRILVQTSRWKTTGAIGCPPSLPLLAAGVLTATRMARDETIAPNNYYARFNQLFGIPGVRRPRGYDETFPVLWEWLNWWLEDVEGGDRGIGTAREHPHYTLIGWALSQALFREWDRQRLTYFFRWLDLAPGEKLSEAELLTYFRQWVRGHGHVSSGVRRMVDDESYWPQLSGILVTEDQNWDGSLRDEAGRRVAPVHVTIETFPRPTLALWAECPEGFPGRGEFADSRYRVTLSRGAPGWYGGVAIPVTDAVLTDGLRLEGNGFVLSWGGGSAIPLRVDESVGAWRSVSHLIPGVMHFVLVHPRLAGEVETLVALSAETGWDRRAIPELPGWALFRGVTIERPLDRRPPDGLEHLVPLVRERPATRGGLRLARGAFLTGGEPDVWIPPAEEATREVRLGTLSWDVGADGATIPLRGLRLSEGHHEVFVEPSKLAIDIVAGSGSIKPAGTGGVVTTLERADDGTLLPLGPEGGSPGDLRPGLIEICGAVVVARSEDIPRTLEPPVLLPVAAIRNVVVGSIPGQVTQVPTPQRPRWMTRIGMHAQRFEFQAPFSVVWIGSLFRRGWEIRLRGSQPPVARPADSGSEGLKDWSEFFLGLEPPVDTRAAELWGRYVQSARDFGP